MEFVSEINRKDRRQDTAEDFTPLELVNQMLDKLPTEYFKEKKNFLDNSAGNGNIIVEVIRRKLANGMSYTDALNSTYAIEILPDNVSEMKHRIRVLIKRFVPDADTCLIDPILEKNIVCYDALDWDYDNWRPMPHPIQLNIF